LRQEHCIQNHPGNKPLAIRALLRLRNLSCFHKKKENPGTRKRGTSAGQRRKKYLKGKGFFLTKSSFTNLRMEAPIAPDRYAKRDRRVKKTRISQALDSNASGPPQR